MRRLYWQRHDRTCRSAPQPRRHAGRPPAGRAPGGRLQTGRPARAASGPRAASEPHHLPVAGSVHARADEPERRLRAHGGHRRRDGGRHRGAGDRIEYRRLSCRRFHPVRQRLAGVRVVGWRRRAQARSGRRADLHSPGRARHAGAYRLRRPARHRPAATGRNGGRIGRLGRGGRGRGPDRPHQGLPRGGRGRCTREVRLRDGRARFRRLRQPLRSGLSPGTRSGLPGRHRRLLRERRRRRVRGGVAAAQHVCARAYLRAHCQLQPVRAAARSQPGAAADGVGASSAGSRCAGSSSGTMPIAKPTSCATSVGGFAPAIWSTRRTSSRVWSRPCPRSRGCSRARTSANCSCGCRATRHAELSGGIPSRIL